MSLATLFPMAVETFPIPAPACPAPTDPADLRVAIARDVIAQIDAEALNLSMVTYMSFVDARDRGLSVEDSWPTDIEQKCFVCAKGAMVISKARIVGGVRFRDLFPDEDSRRTGDALGIAISDALMPEFSPIESSLIECAFERSKLLVDEMASPRDEDRAKEAEAFGRRHRHAYDRLRAIMANVVENGGEFRP